MQDFRNLKLWQKAHALTLSIYQASTRFPADERFGLTIQLRRAASAIPINIADGCGRSTDMEFWKSLSTAMGSANQLEYMLLLSRDLGFLSEETYSSCNADCTEVKRMIAGLIQSLHTER